MYPTLRWWRSASVDSCVSRVNADGTGAADPHTREWEQQAVPEQRGGGQRCWQLLAGERRGERVAHVRRVGVLVGVHRAAQWNALSFYDKRETMGMDARCFHGGFLVSTGPNRFTGRYVDAHLDIPMRECTVSLDEDVVLETGTLVGVDALVS